MVLDLPASPLALSHFSKAGSQGLQTAQLQDGSGKDPAHPRRVGLESCLTRPLMSKR